MMDKINLVETFEGKLLGLIIDNKLKIYSLLGRRHSERCRLQPSSPSPPPNTPAAISCIEMPYKVIKIGQTTPSDLPK